MIDFSRKLKEIREHFNLNKKELAEIVELSASTITRYEEDGMGITLGTIFKISEKLHVNVAWFLGLVENMYDELDTSFKKIPVLSGADHDSEVFEYENYSGFEVVKADLDIDFCFKQIDDSMIKASIKPNSIVCFKKQDFAESGDIVLVSYGETLAVRRYHKYGKQIVLKEEGPKTIDHEVASCKIIGKAVLNITEVE